MKQKLIQAYMQTAKTFAELSHARRLHVGAIVVKDDRIIQHWLQRHACRMG